MNKISIKNNIYNMVLWIIILLQVIFMIVLGHYYKQGMYLDEYYSYGLANSYYNPFIYMNSDWMNNWHPGQEFAEYLTVQPQERFTYDSVYFNQSQDVHPPVYYFVLHTVCSLFPNVFSKWLGLSINIILFIIVQFLIFVIVRQMANNNVGLLACVCSGFSLGSANLVLFIRMYMLLAGVVLFCIYLHTKLICDFDILFSKASKGVWRECVYGGLVFLTTIVGTLTHYYYIVFAFFISVFFVIFTFVKKKIRCTVAYAVDVLGALLVSYMFFPHMKNHILYGDRGKGTIENALDYKGWFKRIAEYMTVIIRQQLGNYIFATVLFAAILIAIIFIVFAVNSGKNRNIRIIPDEKKRACYWMMFLSMICYCVVASIVSPFVEGRYVYAAYPVIVILVVLMVYYLTVCIMHYERHDFRIAMKIKKYDKVLLLSIVAVYIACNWIGNEEIQFSYPTYGKNIDIIDGARDRELIYLTGGSYEAIALVKDFAYFKETYPMSMENIANLDNIVNGCSGDEPLYIFFDIGYDSDVSRQKVVDNTCYNTWEYLYSNEGYGYSYGSMYKFY